MSADPIARLVDERNAAVREYHMVMSERDSVHREMERLTESLAEATRRAQGLEREKKAAVDDAARVKREVTALQLEKERILRECYELRLKYNVSTKYSSKVSDESHMPLAAIRSSLTRSAPPAPPLRGWPTKSGGPVRDVSLLALNQEVDAIRLQMAQLELDLYESKNEAEMSKRRRDWAIAEKKKMGLERESMKQLCECLRKERNQRDRELAQTLIENEELKRQLSDAMHALHELHSDKLHASDRCGHDMESPLSSSAACSSDPLILPTACSRDSAIYADLLEAEPDLHIDVSAKSRGTNNTTSRLHTSPTSCGTPPDRPKPGQVRDILISNKSIEPLGIGIFWNEKNGSIFVSAVSENSIAAQAGIQVGDQLLDINGVNMRCQATRKIASTVLCQTKKSEDDLKIRVQYNPEKFEDCYPKLRDDSAGPSSPLPAVPSSSRCQTLAGETCRRKAELRETCMQSCKKL